MERGATLQIRPGLENVCLIYKEVWFAGQVFMSFVKMHKVLKIPHYL